MCVLFCRYRVGCCQDMVDVCFGFVGIERDAVSIFSKYLSHDASHPIGITEELRNEVMSKSILYP